MLLVSLVLGPEKRRFKDPLAISDHHDVFGAGSLNSRRSPSLFFFPSDPSCLSFCIFYRFFILSISRLSNQYCTYQYPNPHFILYSMSSTVINAGRCCPLSPFFKILFILLSWFFFFSVSIPRNILCITNVRMYHLISKSFFFFCIYINHSVLINMSAEFFL